MTTIYLTLPPLRQTIAHQWRTNIQTGIAGREARAALFTWPRLSFDLTFDVPNTAKANWLRRNLYLNAHNIWGVPVWPDKTRLSSAASSGQPTLNVESTENRRFYVGRQVMVADPNTENYTNFETGTIASMTATSITLEENLTATWAVALVMPVIECRIDPANEIDQEYFKLGAFRITATEAFEELRDYDYTLPESGATTYEDKDVFEFDPLQPGTKHGFDHPYELSKFIGKGISESIYDDADAHETLSFRYLQTSHERIWNIIKFFDANRGRYGEFRIPSWRPDIVVTAAFGSSATQLTTENVEYSTTFLANDRIGRHVMIRFPDGSKVYRKITAATATTITLNSSVGTAATADELNDVLISFLSYARFESDTIGIDYIRDGAARFSIGFRGIITEETPERPAELFRFWNDAQSWYYTSGDVAVTYDENEYTPAPINRDTMTTDESLDPSKITLTISAVEEPIVGFIANYSVETVWCSIMRADRDDDPVDPEMIFLGQVSNISFQGTMADDAAGTARKGSYLKNGSDAHIYHLNWSISAAAAVANDVFKFAVFINATPCPCSYAERKFSSTDIGVLAGTSIVSLSASDIVTIGLQNVGNTGNITIKHMNLNMVKI